MTWETLLERSHAPYSGRREVCLVVGETGCYPGVRIENAAFPLTIGALRGAVTSCLSQGDQPRKIAIPSGRGAPSGAELRAWSHPREAAGPLPVERLASLPKDWTEAAARFAGQAVAEGDLHVDSEHPKWDLWRRKRLGELLTRAVTPNSDFPVSCLLQTDRGLVTGVNVEVDDWSGGLCAERVALHTALAVGAAPAGDLAVHAPKSQLCSPCGSCRQTLAEWPGIRRLLLYHGDGTSSQHRLRDLLPFQFHTSSLHNADRA